MIRDLKTQVKSGVVCVPGNTCTARAQEDVLGEVIRHARSIGTRKVKLEKEIRAKM